MCGCTSTALARDTFKATISCTTWVHCTNCTDPAHHWSRITCTIAPIWSSLSSDSVLLSFYKMQQCPCTASTNGQWRLQGVFLDCSAHLLVDTSFSSSNQCSVIYPRIPARSRILHPNKDKSFLITPRMEGFHWADALFLPLCCASNCTAIALPLQVLAHCASAHSSKNDFPLHLPMSFLHSRKCNSSKSLFLSSNTFFSTSF